MAWRLEALSPHCLKVNAPVKREGTARDRHMSSLSILVPDLTSLNGLKEWSPVVMRAPGVEKLRQVLDILSSNEDILA